MEKTMEKEYVLRKVKRLVSSKPTPFGYAYITGQFSWDKYQEGLELMDEQGNKRIIWEKL